MKKIGLLLSVFFIFVCYSIEDNTKINYSNDKIEEKKTWVEGRAYYNKGKDTTICSEPYTLENEIDGKVVTVTYQDCWERQWEYKYESSGNKIDVWFWDDESFSWYSIPKSGGYYVFRWVYKTKSIID